MDNIEILEGIVTEYTNLKNNIKNLEFERNWETNRYFETNEKYSNLVKKIKEKIGEINTEFEDYENFSKKNIIEILQELSKGE